MIDWLELAAETSPILADPLADFTPGSFVLWQGKDAVQRGRIRQVFDRGAIASESGPLRATPQNPAFLVERWVPVPGGWQADGAVLGLPLAALTAIASLQLPPISLDANFAAQSNPDPLAPLIARVAAEVSSLAALHLADFEQRAQAIASQDLSDRAKFEAMRANFADIDPQDMADGLARSLLVAWFGGEQSVQDGD